MHEAKHWFARLLGLVPLALGLIPLLNRFGVIGFNWPDFILKLIPTIGVWLLAVLGFILFIDEFTDQFNLTKTVGLIFALLLVAVGVIQLLAQFGVIGFSIPFLDGIVMHILLTLEGLGLIIASFTMW